MYKYVYAHITHDVINSSTYEDTTLIIQIIQII